MGNEKANLGRGGAVALFVCLAVAWPRFAFSAALTNSSATSASTPSQADESVDGQPDVAVEFSGKSTVDGKTDSKTSDTPAVADASVKKSPFSSLRFAPIYWRIGGSVGYNFSWEQSGANPATTQEALTTSLNVAAKSYIWQPWFAKIGAAMTYMNNVTTSSGVAGAGATPPTSSVTGNADLQLLPLSRYPFTATISQSESFTGYGTGAPNSQSNTLRLSQRYSPRNYLENYAANLTRNLAGGMNLAKERTDSLDFSASTRRFKQQSHSLDASSTRRYSPTNNSNFLANRLVLLDEYKPDSTFALRGTTNANYSNAHVAQSVAQNEVLQLSGIASWAPKNKPYYLNFAMRGLATNSFSAASPAMPLTRSTARGVFSNLSGVYTVNQYIRLDASANFATEDKNGQRTQTANLASNQSANINYPLPSINFGDLRYTRGVSASFTNRTNTQGKHARQTVSVSPRHGLRRNLGWMGGTLGLGLNQGLLLSKASQNPENASISHQGTASWAHQSGKQTSTIALSASDGRALLGPKSFNQMINLQAMLNTELNRNSSWGGNLTMQTARSGNGQLTSPFVSSSSASLNYQNRRMFNISRMEFSSNLEMTSKSLLPVSASTQNDATLSWVNKLNYKIGRINLSLSGNLRQTQNVTSKSIMFSAMRSFGS